eukprot:7596723-Pyramimonas_sp.AAC.1
MFCAAADARGSYGSQLWVSYDLRFKPEAWESPHPRLVLAAGSIRPDGDDQVPVILVAAHAPHSLDRLENQCAFWELLGSHIRVWRSRYASAALVMAIDANARVASIKSPSIGTCEIARETPNGA